MSFNITPLNTKEQIRIYSNGDVELWKKGSVRFYLFKKITMEEAKNLIQNSKYIKEIVVEDGYKYTVRKYSDGTIEFFDNKNARLHRLNNKPSRILPNGKPDGYHKNGHRHRTNGPTEKTFDQKGRPTIRFFLAAPPSPKNFTFSREILKHQIEYKLSDLLEIEKEYLEELIYHRMAPISFSNKVGENEYTFAFVDMEGTYTFKMEI